MRSLPPAAILATARADLLRHSENSKRSATGDRGFESLAFHWKHVRGAKSPRDLILRALADVDRGRNSPKRQTRMLYADAGVLHDAAMVETEPATE